jgi:hypothetical protein
MSASEILRKAALQKPYVQGSALGLRPKVDLKTMRQGMEEEGRGNLPGGRKDEEEG